MGTGGSLLLPVHHAADGDGAERYESDGADAGNNGEKKGDGAKTIPITLYVHPCHSTHSDQINALSA